MGRSWEQKSIKNRSKIAIQDGVHLGIEFQAILVGFGRQVGAKLASKIDKKQFPCSSNRFQKLQNVPGSSQKQPEAREIDFQKVVEGQVGG